MADRSVRVTLSAVVAPYVSSMARASASTKALSREIVGAASRADKEFRTLRQAGLVVGAGIGGGLALAAKSAIDFESAMAGVRKTLPEGADFDAITEGIREMARELPATHQEIAGVAEAAGQLGVSAGGLLEFTRTMIDLGETTNLTSDQAATAIARLGNIMQTSEGDVDRLGAALVALGNDGASTESEILDMGVRIASAGKQVGLTESDVLAFANTLSSLGVEAEAGGTAISRVMIDVAKAVGEGGDKLDTFAGVAGQSAEQFAAAFREDAASALIAFVEGLGALDGTEMFAILDELGLADVRVGNALRSLAGSGDLFRRSIELGSRAWEENTALSDEAARRYDTTAAKLEVLRNNLTDLGVGLGTVALPGIKAVTSGLTGLTEVVGGLPMPIQAGAAGLIALAGAGTGALAGLGFLLPKIREGRDELARLGLSGADASRSMRLLGTAMRGFVGITAGFAIGSAVMDWLTDLRHGTADVDLMSEAITNLGLRMATTGELTSQFGPGLEDLKQKVRDARRDIGLGGETSWRVFWNKDEVKDAKNDIDALDKSLAGLVSAGHADAAASAVRELQHALVEQGGDVDDLDEVLDDYAAALARGRTESLLTGDAAGELGGDLDNLGGDAEGATDKVKELSDAFFGARDAEESYDDALRSRAEAADDIRDAEEDLAEAVRDQARAQEEAALAVERAQRALRSAQHDVERANRDLGEAQEEAAARQRDYDEAVADFGPNSKRAHDALEALEEANFRVGDAQFSLEDAHLRVRDANRELAESHQRLLDEMNGVGDGADRVRDAQDRLVEANERLNDADGALVDATIGLQQALDNEKAAFDGNNEAASALIGWLQQLQETYPLVADAIQPLIDQLQALKTLQEETGTAPGAPGSPFPGGFSTEPGFTDKDAENIYGPAIPGFSSSGTAAGTSMVSPSALADSVPFNAWQLDGGSIDYDRLAAAMATRTGPRVEMRNEFREKVDPLHLGAELAYQIGVRR